MTPSEYLNFKGLKRENLRDHAQKNNDFSGIPEKQSFSQDMNDLELIFTMLGERVTTEITKNKNARGFPGCEKAAKEGGEVAGNARKDAEKRIGQPIISSENYLKLTEKKKKQLDLK